MTSTHDFNQRIESTARRKRPSAASIGASVCTHHVEWSFTLALTHASFLYPLSLKLLLNIIKSHIGDGGCALNLVELQVKECIVAYFPLHDPTELKSLKDKWFSWKFAPWAQPLGLIKDYFGEKVGLYFAWLGEFCCHALRFRDLIKPPNLLTSQLCLQVTTRRG